MTCGLLMDHVVVVIYDFNIWWASYCFVYVAAELSGLDPEITVTLAVEVGCFVYFRSFHTDDMVGGSLRI
jgi:hypothetical protein